MIVLNWPENVNQRFNLEGDWGLENGYIEEIQFESGKKRILLKNSYIPVKYPLSLFLDNEIPVKNNSTEFNEFKKWFNISLRYGTMPFTIPRIGYKRNIFTKTGQIGVYRFIPQSLTFDTIDGIIQAGFELEEMGYLEEVNYRFLMTQSNKILLTSNGKFIIVEGE